MAGSELAKINGPLPPPPVTGTNVALNKPVTYSSQQAGNEAHRAVDGDATTRWSADTYPEWIRVDLGQVYSINKTELLPYSNRAYQYRIEVSIDGTSFTQVVDRTNNTTGGAVLTDSFSAVNARYVRLTVTGASGYTGTWVSIQEFRVYETSDWTGSDIGAVGAAGSYTLSGDSYTLYGSGADVWGTADECYFLRREITGDFSITARVVSASYADNYSQFGVMIRNSLGVNAAMAAVCWSRYDGVKQVKSLARTSTGGSISISTKVSGPAPPVYLRLTRMGNVVTAYKSDDGSSFSQVNQYTIGLNSNVYVGIYVCSHVDGTMVSGQFDSVSITQ